jgi:hypothetical protein
MVVVQYLHPRRIVMGEASPDPACAIAKASYIISIFHATPKSARIYLFSERIYSLQSSQVFRPDHLRLAGDFFGFIDDACVFRSNPTARFGFIRPMISVFSDRPFRVSDR